MVSIRLLRTYSYPAPILQPGRPPSLPASQLAHRLQNALTLSLSLSLASPPQARFDPVARRDDDASYNNEG